jgi:hypothetical protein
VYGIDLAQAMQNACFARDRGEDAQELTDGNIIQNKGSENWNDRYRLAEQWHYGDPPRHDCVGDTMNSEPEWSWNDD